MFKKLENFNFSDLVNRTITIPELMDVHFNITDLRLEGFSMDSTQQLFNLVGNDQAIFSFRDFKGAIKANYMFVTDPPLLADIGSIHFENYNATFSINGITTFANYDLEMKVYELSLDIEPFVLSFDGISDTSDVISRFLTFGGNVIRDRLVSLSHYDRALQKLNNFINAVIDVLPDELHFPGSNLYLEGGLAKNFKIKQNTYILIPLDASLQNEEHPYILPNLAVFGDYVQNDYQLQIFLSEFILESGISSLFYDNLLQVKGLHIPIGTTQLDIALLGALSTHGFAHGQNCSVNLRVIGDLPDLFITEKSGLSFKSQIAIDIQCIRNSETTEYSQVFTINSTPIVFTGKIEISNQLTVKLHIDDFTLNIESVSNSTVGNINLDLLKVILKLFEPVTKEVINFVFAQGIDLMPFLKMIGLDFIEFEKTLLVPMDNYFLFFVTPIFKLDKLDGMFQEILEEGYAYITSSKVLNEIVNASASMGKDKVEE